MSVDKERKRQAHSTKLFRTAFYCWIKHVFNDAALSVFLNSISKNHSRTQTEAEKGAFHLTKHSYAKTQNSENLNLVCFCLIDRCTLSMTITIRSRLFCRHCANLGPAYPNERIPCSQISNQFFSNGPVKRSYHFLSLDTPLNSIQGQV